MMHSNAHPRVARETIWTRFRTPIFWVVVSLNVLQFRYNEKPYVAADHSLMNPRCGKQMAFLHSAQTSVDLMTVHSPIHLSYALIPHSTCAFCLPVTGTNGLLFPIGPIKDTSSFNRGCVLEMRQPFFSELRDNAQGHWSVFLELERNDRPMRASKCPICFYL